MSQESDKGFKAVEWEDLVPEDQEAITQASTGEFERYKRSLRRQAGLDLTRWERFKKRLAGLFGVNLRFK